MPATSNLRLVAPTHQNRTVAPGRTGNSTYRKREYLTPAEIEKLIEAAKGNRYGHRDATMILVAFRHGLRASELCDLEWSQIDWNAATLVAAKSAEITLEGILRELDEAIGIAKHKNQPNALVNAAALRAKLGGLMIDKSQVELNATINEFDGCETTQQMAQAALESVTNYRWLPVSDQDRAELTAIFDRFGRDLQAKLDEVERRPLVPGSYRINGKALPSS